MFSDLVKKNRSYRRFYEDFSLKEETLLELIELTRYTASAANRQALRYSCCTEVMQSQASQRPQGYWAGLRE